MSGPSTGSFTEGNEGNEEGDSPAATFVCFVPFGKGFGGIDPV
jgi:hypothetical protein